MNSAAALPAARTPAARMPAARLPLKLGTRASALAMAQAREAATTIARHLGLGPEDVVPVPMSTSGDRHLDGTLVTIGGKGLFTKEIEEALLAGSVDLAVHSMKDVATRIPHGLLIPCCLPRADLRDVLLSNHDGGLAGLPPGAVFGTASLRRAAQLLHRRPDLRIVPFRGNVQTRIKKLAEGQADATMLAVAGLQRLGLWNEDGEEDATDPRDFLPAPAQGAIGLQCRENDAAMRELLDALNHPPTFRAVIAERAMLHALDGSCRTPIGCYAEGADDGSFLRLSGLVVSPDGRRLHRHEAVAPPEQAEALGREVGERLRAMAGENFFTELALP